VIIILVPVIGLLVGVAAFVLAVVIPNRTPPELRGDWWSRFETEFRAYARQAAPRRTPEANDGTGKPLLADLPGDRASALVGESAALERLARVRQAVDSRSAARGLTRRAVKQT
jgi:hypothetical protein